MGKYIDNFASFSERMKETRTLKEEEERSAKQEKYAQFFKKLLQKYNVTSPADLNDEKKKKFFNDVDKGWDGELTPSGEDMMNEGRNAFLVALNNARSNGETTFEFNGSTYTVKNDIREDKVSEGYESATSIKEMCGKIHDSAKAYEADEEEQHTYEGYVGEMYESVKKMYEACSESTVAESFKIDKKSNPNYKWEFEVKSFNDPRIAKILKNGGYKKLSAAGIEFGTDPQGMLIMGDTEKEKKTAIKTLNSLGINENFQINESEINSDADFREYATIVLKKQHGEDFDAKKAEEVIDGLLKKKEGDDYGTIIGMLNRA